ncbi:MAG: C69 family dipeptidase [Firmicutes bacterium]|uniref:Dipeptidase n=1 Tax=Candidatus Gallilactobacillus intestinavium TaxID=2840838 RepID=A0A9D9E5Q2_9LACO|nr:C69 family dipeptidase [Candidatus Gallilactobacillus intestinavium]
MKNEKACTTVLVGKKASIDGSVMIARNDDTFLPITPQKFLVRPAFNRKDFVLKSNQNNFSAVLPEHGYRYQATPNVDVDKEGIYDESGFNEKNVAMSATESVYANERVLAVDPLVKDGIAEDTIQTLVLPFIDSAKQGVQYLGKLIEKYGSAEGNGVIFADKNDIWYMEIVTGHHWVASRIPDDMYAVIANQVSQENIDLSDKNNYLVSTNIENFVKDNNLNPDRDQWNVRHIFGTSNEKDRHYNTPRVWFGQKYLNPEIEQDPESSNLPFLRHANRLISLEDIEYIEGSHYNETKFDPLGSGEKADKLRYRPISLNRTQQSHVLQIRNNVPDDLSTIMWISIGVPSFTPFIPFYGNSIDTDKTFNNTSLKFNINDAYWMYRTVAMLVESHYSKFVQMDLDYLSESHEELNRMIKKIDLEVKSKSLSGSQLTEFLTESNHKIVDHMRSKTMNLIGNLITNGLELSKLTFNMDKNL